MLLSRKSGAKVLTFNETTPTAPVFFSITAHYLTFFTDGIPNSRYF